MKQDTTAAQYFVHDRTADNQPPYIFTGSLIECQKYIKENYSPYLTPRKITKPIQEHPDLPTEDKIVAIIQRKRCGQDCTEEESAFIKGWLRDTVIGVGDGSQQILEAIQRNFPIEYGEYLDETLPTENNTGDKSIEGFTGGLWKIRESELHGWMNIETESFNYSGRTICSINMENDHAKLNAQRIITCVNGWDKLNEDVEAFKIAHNNEAIYSSLLKDENNSLVSALQDIKELAQATIERNLDGINPVLEEINRKAKELLSRI